MRIGLKSGVVTGNATGWKTGMKTVLEWHDDEGSCLVCGAAGSSPNLKPQNKKKVTLMDDSGSQSTACSMV